MTEIWLHSNRRALLLAMVPVAILHLIGWAFFQSDRGLPIWFGVVCLALSAGLCLGLLREVRQPRVAYRDGEMLFYLKTGGPIAVPVRIVEAFFQGEGPAHLPGSSQQATKTVNLIARLSQRETNWHQRDVKSALGCWEEGYITVRGTWCEPITTDLIRRLNRRLREVSTASETPS